MTQSNLALLQQVYKFSCGKVPSKTELDAGRANYSRAMASVRSAEAQVLPARAQLATAQTNLDKARIYSPVNGVVLSRDIEPGQTVAARSEERRGGKEGVSTCRTRRSPTK